MEHGAHFLILYYPPLRAAHRQHRVGFNAPTAECLLPGDVTFPQVTHTSPWMTPKPPSKHPLFDASNNPFRFPQGPGGEAVLSLQLPFRERLTQLGQHAAEAAYTSPQLTVQVFQRSKS